MRIHHARDAIAGQLNPLAHTIWQGMTLKDRNEFAKSLAYGKCTLEEAIQEFDKRGFEKWVKVQQQTEE